MYGYMLLVFDPKKVGIDTAHFPQPDSRNDLVREGLQAAIDASPLKGFEAANNTNHNGFVLYDGKKINARVALNIDPRDNKILPEDAPYAGREEVVNMRVWVSVDRSRTERLSCGTWNDQAESVGVEITNDPSKDDHTRMHIFVVAPTLRQAREALIATLEGTKRPEKPWIV